MKRIFALLLSALLVLSLIPAGSAEGSLRFENGNESLRAMIPTK